jgi:hypothetical protein
VTGEGAFAPGEVAFGAEISQDRRLCSIAAAWRDPGARVVAELRMPQVHPSLAVARLAQLKARYRPVAVVIDPKSQAVTLIKPLTDAGVRVTEPSARDVAVAHGEFLDMIEAGDLAHLGQSELTAAVRAAMQRPLAGAQAWERKVPVDQSPLVAATLAVWALLHRPPRPFFLTSGPERQPIVHQGQVWPVRNPDAYTE